MGSESGQERERRTDRAGAGTDGGSGRAQDAVPGKRRKRRRGIYLLPNLMTTTALFWGFFAIIAAQSGRFEAAAMAIFGAMFFDAIDGRIARMTNTQSDFGAEYDSLSDMVSFGLAPALVMYSWSLSAIGKPGWVAAFVYTAGAALRLARFNTQATGSEKRYFQGLASPAAAGLVAGAVWLGYEYQLDGADFAYYAIFYTALAGVLMVSNIRYRSFKDLDFRRRVPFVTLLMLVLAFVLVSLGPAEVLFGAFLLYALSGPVMTVFHLRKHRARRENRNSGE